MTLVNCYDSDLNTDGITFEDGFLNCSVKSKSCTQGKQYFQKLEQPQQSSKVFTCII